MQNYPGTKGKTIFCPAIVVTFMRHNHATIALSKNVRHSRGHCFARGQMRLKGSKDPIKKPCWIFPTGQW